MAIDFQRIYRARVTTLSVDTGDQALPAFCFRRGAVLGEGAQAIVYKIHQVAHDEPDPSSDDELASEDRLAEPSGTTDRLSLLPNPHEADAGESGDPPLHWFALELFSSDHEAAARESRFIQSLRAADGVVRFHAQIELSLGPRGETRVGLVTDYVEGRKLSDVLMKRRLRPSEAAALGLRLLETLAGIHERGIMHGDVKPANIIVPISGDALLYDRAVLLDFGHAAIGDEQPYDHERGTPFYTPCAPSPGTEVDWRKRDIFAVGVTLYQCMAGRYPWGSLDIPAEGAALARTVEVQMHSRAMHDIRRRDWPWWWSSRTLAQRMFVRLLGRGRWDRIPALDDARRHLHHGLGATATLVRLSWMGVVLAILVGLLWWARVLV